MTLEHWMLTVLLCAVLVIVRSKKNSDQGASEYKQRLDPLVIREMKKQVKFDLYVDLGYFK